MFELVWTREAESTFGKLKSSPSSARQYKAVRKTLELLASNPRHPGLQTHEYVSLEGPNKEKVFEAYAQQNTPAAYRVFWYYGPSRGSIIILAITSHP
ncbi:MAG: hypothetical protein HYX80_02355 [Chloroflexi bacterium]|nr:hypothetical protein [Chloroflexota bacterium]